MYYLFWCKKRLISVSLVIILLGAVQNLFAQSDKVNNPNYDVKQWVHFGITLGGNASEFKIKRSNSFINNDTILSVEPSRGPGFNLGIISDLHLGEYFDFRFIPTLSFAEKELIYRRKGKSKLKMSIQSTYVDFPFHFKYKSERLQNNRIYVIAGGKYAIDLAAHSDSRENINKVDIVPADVGVEYGIGWDHYFPMFKFSIEFKVTHGVRNVLEREPNLAYSSAINKLYSRTFLVSFHFE